ncbi:MAG: hypothetical protein AVDCRST_MAG73-1843, partial [uncultured Thermomicrobiales bacterium]
GSGGWRSPISDRSRWRVGDARGTTVHDPGRTGRCNRLVRRRGARVAGVLHPSPRYVLPPCQRLRSDDRLPQRHGTRCEDARQLRRGLAGFGSGV